MYGGGLAEFVDIEMHILYWFGGYKKGILKHSCKGLFDLAELSPPSLAPPPSLSPQSYEVHTSVRPK